MLMKGTRAALLITLLLGSTTHSAESRPQAVANDTAISVALTGDAIITRPWSQDREPAFTRMVELLRSQDAAFTNLEISLLDYQTYPMVESGGLHLRAAPAMAGELAWAGFKLASFANNHALDWGVEGMRLTRRHATEAGMVVAGIGDSLAEARSPQFLQTARGRIALIACASTFAINARAGASLGDIPARPGLSPLRFKTQNVLTASGMAALRTVASDLGQKLPQTGPVTFMDKSFQTGTSPGRHSQPHPQDLTQLAAAVRSAKGVADLTIVSIHAHEEGDGPNVPPEFLVTFARAMIDAGADVFVGHGPHALRGIEIYKGKPIFYSLGDFIFQNETVDRLPLDDFENIGADPAGGVAGLNDMRYDNDRRGFPTRREVWEGLIAVPRLAQGKLQSVELHPVSLGFGKPRPQRGRPELADEQTARKIISDLQRLSAPFGTKIEYRDGSGSILLD